MGIFKNWFKNNNLVVCGDSFGTIDARQDVDKQWPNLLNATTLARAGACSTYIHAQVKYAVEELEADELIVWSTSADRFIFPIQPNKKSQSITPSLEPRSFNPSDWEDAEITAGPIKANTIRTNLREFEINYQYPDYDPKWHSDIIRNFNVPGGPFNKPNKDWTEGQVKAFRTYILYLSDTQKMLHTRNLIMENMCYYLTHKEIPTTIVDLVHDFKFDSDYVTVINELPIKEFNVDYDCSLNHMDYDIHSIIADFFQNL